MPPEIADQAPMLDETAQADESLFDAGRIGLAADPFPTRRATTIGVAAGVLGAGLVLAMSALGAPAWTGLLIGAGLGGLMALGAVPRAWIGRRNEEEAALVNLAHALERLNLEARQHPLRALLIDRPGIAGALSQVIHTRLRQALACHAHARQIERTLDDTVERRTRLATADLARQATTDPLTGLGNRRALEASFNDLYQGSAAPRRPAAILLMDFDLFKDINDTLGHEMGDACLTHLGDCLRSAIRHEDVAVRLGGDEFAVLLVNRTSHEAEMVAERIRDLFGQLPWFEPRLPRPTISIGLAHVAQGRPCPPAELIRRGDAALYHAKSRGRNLIAREPRDVAAA